MRSKASDPPRFSSSDFASLPRSSNASKIAIAGGQVPTQMLAPASASAFAMANPNPPSSATPATKARLPERSIGSMAQYTRGTRQERRESFVSLLSYSALSTSSGGLFSTSNEFHKPTVVVSATRPTASVAMDASGSTKWTLKIHLASAQPAPPANTDATID